MAAKRIARKIPVDLRNRKALLEHDPAPADVIEQARQIKEKALLNFGLGDSVIASWVFTKCHHHIPTTAIGTMTVVLLGDGSAMLLYNPYFTVALGEDGAMFALYHEARHLIQKHLFTEPHLWGNSNWTTATELCINHVVMTRLKRGMLEVDTPQFDDDGTPIIDPKTGVQKMAKAPSGVNPKQVFKDYKDDLREQGLTPVDYASFVRTDLGCFAELERIVNPPKPGSSRGGGATGECIHQDDDGTGDGVPMDAETAEQLGKQVLHNTMQAAMAGKEKAREELLELGDRTDGATERVSKLWGDLGLARLRGETLQVRKVDWWKQWLNDTLASKLKDGDRLQYNKKRGGLDMLLGLDPMLMRRGSEELKVVLVAYDTSGSMPDEVLKYLTQLVGYTDGVEAHWVSFDGVIMPFAPGERVMGGGGTNFQNVVDYAEGRLEVDGSKMDQHPDCILMLTDGDAAPVRPADPDKWMWLITDGGTDDWIKSQTPTMDFSHIKTGDGV